MNSLAVDINSILSQSTLLGYLWSTDENEYNVLGQSGWTQEGDDGYIFPTQVSGSVALYRVFHKGPAKHLWTTDQNEYNVLVGSGWQDEGIVGYVMPSAS